MHPKHPLHPLLGKTTRTLGIMALVLAVPYASPRLARFRVVEAPWGPKAELAQGEPPAGAVTEPAAPVLGEATLTASENHGSVTNALPAGKTPPPDPEVLAKTAGSLAVEDPSGHALDAFYAKLASTAHGDAHAVTRILHYGDSVITSDFVSGTLRRRMQEKFGDAGHGFILVANPWEWYFHNDVQHTASDGWNMSRITGPLSGDGMYGLGGVSFHTAGAASAWFATASKGDYGRKVSRFDVYYLEQPWGGDVDLVIPGHALDSFSTRGPKKVSRVHSVEVPDGASSMSLRTRGSGDVRVFGVALEREGPGVVVDALGANGARGRLWAVMSEAHWQEQMELRKPGLVILQYGTNESEEGKVVREVYTRQLGELLDKVKAAVGDEASILVASPLDRAERGPGGKLQTRAIIPELVAIQREVALAHGVGFWSTYDAMGGAGSMAKWVKADPQLGSWDLTHPTPAGAEIIGDLLFKALTTGLEAYEARARK